MRQPDRQIIAAAENDLKNNRLGLMSQAQLRTLGRDIRRLQAQTAQLTRRGIALAALVTAAVVILSFVRVLLLPLALIIELAVIGAMIYLVTSLNRFVQQLTLDRESETVRIVKGRASRHILRHPLYLLLRVEARDYKLLDATLPRQFTAGELYQLYVLPQAGVIIAAETISEKQAYYRV